MIAVCDTAGCQRQGEAVPVAAGLLREGESVICGACHLPCELDEVDGDG